MMVVGFWLTAEQFHGLLNIEFAAGVEGWIRRMARSGNELLD
jgi:hypothetical protein